MFSTSLAGFLLIIACSVDADRLETSLHESHFLRQTSTDCFMELTAEQSVDAGRFCSVVLACPRSTAADTEPGFLSFDGGGGGRLVTAVVALPQQLSAERETIASDVCVFALQVDGVGISLTIFVGWLIFVPWTIRLPVTFVLLYATFVRKCAPLPV